MSYFSEVIADTPRIYLRLNDSSGTVATDSSGNGVNGTYIGSPSLGVGGLIAGDADTAMLTTINQQVTLPYSLGNNTFTIELWWKWTAPGTPGGIIRDNTAAGGTGYILSANSTGLHVRIAGADRQVSTIDHQDGVRHHFVLSYDGSTATFYADGVQLDSWSRVSATLPATPIHIGYNGTNSGQYQPGVYDEVALYNYVLAPARVAAHYTAAGIMPTVVQSETVYIEALSTGTAQSQVHATYVEALGSGTPSAQSLTTYLEALALVQPAEVSAVYTETVLSVTPEARIGAVYSESVLTGIPAVQIESVYTELVVSPIPSAGFKGWGQAV